MAAALLDMAYHTRNTTDSVNPNEFEKATLEKIGLIPEITVRYRSPYFQHIFAGGYSSGYYAYTWQKYWMPMLSKHLKKPEQTLLWHSEEVHQWMLPKRSE